jgi:hypothetical protein
MPVRLFVAVHPSPAALTDLAAVVASTPVCDPPLTVPLRT